MSEHTSVPWIADPDYREGCEWNIHIVSAAKPDCAICFMANDSSSEANAAFIIRAVNSHDALVTFTQYVLEMDPESNAPLFAKAREALGTVQKED